MVSAVLYEVAIGHSSFDQGFHAVAMLSKFCGVVFVVLT